MGLEAISRLGASRQSLENPQSPGQRTPTTFFMATEDDVEKSQSPPTVDDSTFGVKSMEETTVKEDPLSRVEVEGGRESHEIDIGRRRLTLKPKPRSRDRAPDILQTAFSTPSGSTSPRKLRRASPPSTSHSLASLSQASLGPGSSLPSSPKSNSSRSFRPSDEESTYEGGSQAIASSEDEAEMSSETRDGAPQLIMPSIKMPSRRPFTNRGKDMGRLKVLIAGDSGTDVLNISSQNMTDEQ